MSGNLKLKATSDYSGSGASGAGGAEYGYRGGSSSGPSGGGAAQGQSSDRQGGLRPTIAALLTTWISLSVVMISVFLVGFYLGRQHGVKIALNGQPDGAARLPIVPQSIAIREAEHATASADLASGSLPSGAADSARAQLDKLAEAAAEPVGSQLVAGAKSPVLENKQVTESTNKVELAKVDGAVKGSSVLLAEQKIDFTQTAPLAGSEAAGTSAGQAINSKLAAKETALEKQTAEHAASGPAYVGQDRNTVENSAADRSTTAYNTAGFGAKPAMSAADIARSSGRSIQPEGEKKSSSGEQVARAALSERTSSAAEVASATASRTESSKGESRSSEPKVVEPKVKDKLKNGWYIQIAAKTDQKEAAALARKLSGSKVQTSIEAGVVRGVTYYRVVSGPFKSRDAATPTLKRVKNSGIVSTEPFLKQVK